MGERAAVHTKSAKVQSGKKAVKRKETDHRNVKI